MLLDDLKKVTEGVYPFHMPGHKRQKKWLRDLYDTDLTEIAGADDLHAPSGIIYDAQRRAARFCGTISTIFLTGGSTCGILAAISALAKEGDGILIGRNCHKSVYNACKLNRLNTHFAYPELKPRLGCFGEITPAEISEKMQSFKARVVVITSPTYEGIVSDIKAISKVVHKNHGILVVDSAHGAHLGFHTYFPESARTLGADIVIESAHKTLPTLTGGALLHLCSHRVSYSAIQTQLGIFETSSPPYPILCSIERGLSAMTDQKLLKDYTARLDRVFGTKFKHLSLFESGCFDRSKLVIFCGDSNLNGFELQRILREEFLIETEMAMPTYLLAMTSVADTDKGFDRLISALSQIDGRLTKSKGSALLAIPKAIPVQPIYHTADITLLPTTDAVGKIAAEFVYAYPPGSPILSPGEIVSREILDYLDYLSACGGQIYSSEGNYPEKIAIFAEND